MTMSDGKTFMLAIALLKGNNCLIFITRSCMPLITPNTRAFEAIRADMLGEDSEAWYKQEIAAHEAASSRAVGLLQKLGRKHLPAGYMFVDPASENPTLPGLFNAYHLNKGKTDYKKRPEVILKAGFVSRGAVVASRFMLAATFNRQVSHGPRNESFTPHSQGVSTYDGRPYNDAGASYLSHFPALPSESPEFHNLLDTLNFIEQRAGLQKPSPAAR
jgi:hypothetical protein